MIVLHQFAPAWDLPNLSPFCMKVETYLRMAGVSYEVAAALPPQAPKRKLPFITDRGRRIADSRFILEYLKENYGDTVDGHLTPELSSLSSALQRLIEEDLFWVILYSRWGKRDANWAENKRAIFGGLPPVLRDLVARYARRHICSTLRAHGIARHSDAEIYRIGQHDLDVLSTQLGAKPWFLGDRPCSLDASAFGSLANVLWCPIESPLKEHARKLANLVAFCERMCERYFSETRSASRDRR